MSVAWHEWDERAFAQAEERDVPILLSISAVWCHWCHVMDRTTYAQPAVAAGINAGYVPIRVDTDRRPDINARYNMGGWPTTAILTPRGELLTGATYLGPDDLLRFLDRVSSAYREHREEIDAQLARTHVEVTAPQSGTPLDESLVAMILGAVEGAYDPEYGGFGEVPKFPQADALALLLLEARLAFAEGGRNERFEEMLLTTAHAMARGGMYDHIEGGFFRYSTTRNWSIPHFEKMAEDHAALLPVYAGLYRLTGDDEVRAAMLGAAQWTRNVLRDPHSGLFAGSQDADETYYALDAKRRAARIPPRVDTTIYADWSAQLASAYFAVADATGDASYGRDALVTIDALEGALGAPGGLLYHYRPAGGAPAFAGWLADHVAYETALIDAYEHTGDERRLRRACDLAHAVVAQFGGGDHGFVDHANAQNELGRVRTVARPLRENARMADALLRLAVLADDASLDDLARRTLAGFAPSAAHAGTFGASYALALRRALSPATLVTVYGSGERADALRLAARRLADPFAVVRSERHGDPRAVVCRGTVCASPTANAAEIEDRRRALERLPG